MVSGWASEIPSRRALRKACAAWGGLMMDGCSTPLIAARADTGADTNAVSRHTVLERIDTPKRMAGPKDEV